MGVGGFLGGIEWGMSSDGERLYVANADALVAGRPGLFALAPATGRDIWFAPVPHLGCSWKAVTLCLNAQSAAPTATPGVVYAGTTDGHERAYSAADGRILWDFDTARATYRTINGVSDQSGGAIDVSSGVVADGMLLADLRLSQHDRRRVSQRPARLLRGRPLNYGRAGTGNRATRDAAAASTSISLLVIPCGMRIDGARLGDSSSRQLDGKFPRAQPVNDCISRGYKGTFAAEAER